MSQTSYAQYQAPAYKGMLADLTSSDIESLTAEAAIGFGAPVMLGTDPARQVKPVGTGTLTGLAVIGFAVANHANEQSAAGVANYGVTTTVSVLKKGRMWVLTDDAVAAGAVANLKLSSGLLTDEAVASGIEAFTQVTVHFRTATSAAGLALIEVK